MLAVAYIASTERFEPAEELAKKAPAPTPGETAPPVKLVDLSSGLRGALRGAGKLAAVEASEVGAADTFARLDDLVARAQAGGGQEGVHYRVLRLRNLTDK